ncbi:MAG: dTDP-4-dehydrorhamnose reductase [Bacteroidetes bacterium]|nr:dTDP-4-dehydrorhamnose reductase [Bacteroidota bacterium]MCL5027188.1 dTDP-4-dehydrorhamnose reductase [Chloroflexota bacterium]
MRVFVTGAYGQLGQELQETLAHHTLRAVDVDSFDITDRAAAIKAIAEFRPDTVIHTAAFTNVDACERDPELAHRVNALGTENIALACKEIDAAMVYISTDYVFDGTKGEPYVETDTPNPLGVYARTKHAGEVAVRSTLQRYYIARTAWLYGRGANFVKIILQRAAEGKPMFGVTDEVGSPTYAKDLAQALTRLIESVAHRRDAVAQDGLRPHPRYGTYHLVNEGYCSRYEWICEILRLAGYKQEVTPLTKAEFQDRFPSPTQRPGNSALKNYAAATHLGIRLRPWQEALQDFICTLR